MLNAKTLIKLVLPGYAAGLILMIFVPSFIALAISTAITAGYAWIQINKKEGNPPGLPSMPPVAELVRPLAPAQQPALSRSGPAAALKPETAKTYPAEWAQVIEYIETLEDMVILEGNQNNLDSEIVEKTITLLARVNRIIPELQALSNSEMNHNVKRLVLKDLNGVITPFLSLSGEAKQKNRRILLNGLKDINSKITFYSETIERKDLLELTAKAELIRQRYNTNS